MEQTTPKPFVFVLMPFDKCFDDIYQLGIKAACNDAGGYCERVDEQTFVDSILERIYNQIDKADLLIADMTGRNPNVFYEVGYAHALGKRVLLLTQKADDIPFDLKHYPHIVYEGKITELKKELEKKVRWAFEHPKQFAKASKEQIQAFIQGIRILNCPEVKFQKQNGDAFIHLVFDLHNSTESSIEVAQFQVGLVVEKGIDFQRASDSKGRHEENYSTRSINLPEGLRIHIVDSVLQILPGSWEKVEFVVVVRTGVNQNLITTGFTNFTLRLFSEAGPTDYQFKLGFQN